MQICFKDSRPVLDVRYDIERRVKRLLPRDLEAALDSHNVYVLEYKSDAVTAVNLRNTMERWTKGLAIVEPITSGRSGRNSRAQTGNHQRLSPGRVMLHAQ